ncbi:MAG: DUF1080 domain-containing protein [Lewinellaceae bacterium]|nr:DUF1080 domain-containing protein [Lewinellaceae bacterium]
MKNCRPFVCLLWLSISSSLFFACSNNPPETSHDPDKEEWQSLFNGVNLDGWEPKITGFELNENFNNTFYAEDSMIKVKYDGYGDFGGRFGHLFYKEPFSYYRLKVDYRFVGEQCQGGPEWALRNSGAMLHGQPASTMLKDQDFPISVEAQFLGGDGEHERPTLNLCTPGTNVERNGALVTDHCMESTAKTYHGDQWVHAEFLVLGDSLLQHILEGKVVMEYSKPQYGGGAVSHFDSTLYKAGQPITGGSISLQSESHPVHFKNIMLLNLEGCTDKKAKNYKSYFVKQKNTLCIYD